MGVAVIYHTTFSASNTGPSTHEALLAVDRIDHARQARAHAAGHALFQGDLARHAGIGRLTCHDLHKGLGAAACHVLIRLAIDAGGKGIFDQRGAEAFATERAIIVATRTSRDRSCS